MGLEKLTGGVDGTRDQPKMTPHPSLRIRSPVVEDRYLDAQRELLRHTLKMNLTLSSLMLVLSIVFFLQS
jgi:hypothetical protein